MAHAACVDELIDMSKKKRQRVEVGYAVKPPGETIFMNTVALTEGGAIKNFEDRFRQGRKGTWKEDSEALHYKIVPVTVLYELR